MRSGLIGGARIVCFVDWLKSEVRAKSTRMLIPQKMGIQPRRHAHFFHPASLQTVPRLRVDAVFERLARLERNDVAGFDFHRLAGLRVFAGAGAAVALQEGQPG